MFRLQTTTDKTGPITEVPPKILERILAPRTSTSTSTEEAPVAPEKMVTCVCGAAWWGKEADLIPLVQQHGRDLHNMDATPEQVQAMAYDVVGPVHAEVFILWLGEGHLNLTGPCGADPWYLEIAATEDPVTVVAEAIRRVIGEPVVVHSTSWRRDRSAVVLSFVAVIDPELVRDMPSAPIGRAELARGEAATAPTSIATTQVVEHGLRHLAWLAKDDPLVAQRLSPQWHAVLAGYIPEPFRNLVQA